MSFFSHFMSKLLTKVALFLALIILCPLTLKAAPMPITCLQALEEIEPIHEASPMDLYFLGQIESGVKEIIAKDLNPRQKLILSMHLQGHTFESMAKTLDLSRSRVAVLFQNIIRTIKIKMSQRGMLDAKHNLPDYFQTLNNLDRR